MADTNVSDIGVRTDASTGSPPSTGRTNKATPKGPIANSRDTFSSRSETEKAKQQAADLSEEAKQQLYEATQQAKETGKQYVQDKKQLLGQELAVLSDAIRSAADTLKENQHDSVACYANAAVEQIDRLRDRVENQSSKQWMEDARYLIHKRPEIVYGGLFLAGLATVRFLKASTSGHNRHATAKPSKPVQHTQPIAPRSFPATTNIPTDCEVRK